jgi:hypothetical protein
MKKKKMKYLLIQNKLNIDKSKNLNYKKSLFLEEKSLILNFF